MTIRLIAGCLPLRSASSRSSAAGSNRRTRSQAAGYSRRGGHLLVDWGDSFPPAIPTIVVRGLPGISVCGSKRLQDSSAEGLGDIQLGAKSQSLGTQDARRAATGGVRAPTGRQDDPDDLADVAWSSGAWALLARLHNDFIMSNLWKETPTRANETPIAAPGDVVVDFTFRYDWVLPDSATVRVGDAKSLTTNRERVDRDLGDRFEFEFTGQYQAWRDLSLSALYKYGFKLEDRITGHSGFPTQLLEQNTDSTEQIYIVRANYSTLALYRAEIGRAHV